jgi:hypothetical protein
MAYRFPVCSLGSRITPFIATSPFYPATLTFRLKMSVEGFQIKLPAALYDTSTSTSSAARASSKHAALIRIYTMHM